MEKAFEKLLRRLFLKKYPMYLDVMVKYVKRSIYKEDCYEVFLIIFRKDLIEMDDKLINFIKNIARYIDIKVCGIYNEVVSKEEWEEIKSERED